MGNLKVNSKVARRDHKHKVYCDEDYAQDLYDTYCTHFNGKNITAKDLSKNQVVNVKVSNVTGKHITGITDSGQTVFLDLSKESKFFGRIGLDKPEVGMTMDVMVDSTDNGYTASSEKAFFIGLKRDLMDAIKSNSAAYNVKIKAINDGGFIVDLSGLECFLPGSLAAANKITDFECMIGRELLVMVETYLEPSDMFVVSAKKYIKHILPSKIKDLNLKDPYSGQITGVVDYGCFVEWDEIFTGLLHSSEMDGEAWKGLKSGDQVQFWVKEIRDNNRIILSQKGPNPEIKLYEDFREKYEGEFFDGAVVKDVKPFGIYIKMGEVTGMISPKELRRANMRVNIGDDINVFVKQVDANAKKVYLKLDEE